MPLSQERAARLIAALLASLDNWIEQADEAARHASPGNKGRILHLERSLLQARHSLRQIVGRETPAGGGDGADGEKAD